MPEPPRIESSPPEPVTVSLPEPASIRVIPVRVVVLKSKVSLPVPPLMDTAPKPFAEISSIPLEAPNPEASPMRVLAAVATIRSTSPTPPVSLKVSKPSPVPTTRYSSLPEPPSMTSSPEPPMRTSFPLSPNSLSTPLPPSSVSAPPPAKMVSLPLPPIRMSLSAAPPPAGSNVGEVPPTPVVPFPR